MQGVTDKRLNMVQSYQGGSQEDNGNMLHTVDGLDVNQTSNGDRPPA